ncbi:MAG: hypothetical protein R3B70_42605 [Polyangiaceae bacterium]
MTMLKLSFRFTPADGGQVRDITVTIATQDDEKYPFMLTIDWDDGRSPDHLRWPGPPLVGLELAARFASQRILDRVELWGGGTIHPEVEKSVPYSKPDDGK